MLGKSGSLFSAFCNILNPEQKDGGGESPCRPLGRRRKILELLCVRRHIKIGELAKRFDVTSRTIYSDIEKLSLAYPIYTTSGRGSGGVHLMDEYTPATA